MPIHTEGAYREISELVRPVLAAELGVEYSFEHRVLRYADGTEHHYEDWRCRRDPKASYSVLDPGNANAPWCGGAFAQALADYTAGTVLVGGGIQHGPTAATDPAIRDQQEPVAEQVQARLNLVGPEMPLGRISGLEGKVKVFSCHTLILFAKSRALR